MAIVITSGNYYVTYTDSGATKKTTDINGAHQFATVAEAIKGMKKAEEGTRNYFVFDTLYATDFMEVDDGGRNKRNAGKQGLSCTCYPCNLFKGNILPSDFTERITDIFLYQMERRHKDKIKWKIMQKMLDKMI